MVKKIVIGVAALVAVFMLAMVAMLAPAFMGNVPMVDDAKLPGGAVQVVDGYVSFTILPAGDGQAVLIDCGDDPKGTALLAALEKNKIKPEGVLAVFLTHGHPDHTAGCHLLPNTLVYAFEGDVKLASGEERGKGPLPRMMETPPEKTIKVTNKLVDGQTFALGAVNLTAHAIPGHTAGSAAYVSAGALYLGDAASGGSDGTVKTTPWAFSDSTDQNRESLIALAAKLKKADPPISVLVFSHTGSMGNYAAFEALH